MVDAADTPTLDGAADVAAEPKADTTGDLAGNMSVFEKAAQRTRQSVKSPAPASKAVSISTDREYELLQAGTFYTGPDGRERAKPWYVSSEPDYDKVPEGANYIDPEGQLRQKPQYEGIGFTAQTLYDMALNDKEREKVLERSYPGKVKRTTAKNEFYVDDGGTLRKPGRDFEATTGFLAASALPVGGAVAGAIGGGVAGSAVPGAGNVAGVALGGASGGILGQSFNDMILQLAGVYDRTPDEEATNLALAGLSGGAGAGVGRGIGAMVPGIKAGVQSIGAAAPRAAAHFLGAGAEDTRMALSLAEKGVQVPPSAWAKEAPHLQNLVEVFDPAFHTQQPLLQSATKHYEESAGKVLEALGIKEPGSLTKPTAAVSVDRVGASMLARAQEESVQADSRLRTILEQNRAAAAAGRTEKLEAFEQQNQALREAERESREAAQQLIDLGFTDIQKDIDAAMRTAGAGGNSGELWWTVGEKLKAVKQGISARANKMYGEADMLAGEHRPNISGLPVIAEDFIKQLPEGFEGKYPDIVRKLRDLAGVQNKAGEWIKPPVEPTFGQLHNLRSVFRNNINYYDLTPDIREGAYKFFAQKVDRVLHDPHAVPELKAAAQSLDSADAFYRENMRPLTDKNIQAVVSGLESGLPADPKILFQTLVKEGRSELTSKVKEMVGPNLWAGVRAADVQEMLDASKSLIPGQVDGRAFARQVLDRHRGNMLEAVHGREASEKLLNQARSIEQLAGRLDIPINPTDTLTSVIQRARVAAEATKAAVKQDPLGMLNKEMKQIENEHRRAQSALRAERRQDPLGFLYDPTTGAAEAANKILGNEDLILAAAAKFGEQSPEFTLLRQAWAERLLRDSIRPSEKLVDISKEVQQVMFPGVTLDQAQLLAKEMDFLMETRSGMRGTAQGMSAMAKVENPWANIAGRGGLIGKTLGEVSKIIPGSGPVGRSWLGWYYKLMRDISTNPAFLRWVEKGLKGPPESQEAVRAMLQNWMQRGGVAGAGAGEASFQGHGP